MWSVNSSHNVFTGRQIRFGGYDPVTAPFLPYNYDNLSAEGRDIKLQTLHHTRFLFFHRNRFISGVSRFAESITVNYVELKYLNGAFFSLVHQFFPSVSA